MGIEASAVETMLTRRDVKAGGEVYTKKLGVQDANLTRDAIVKSLYEVRWIWRAAESWEEIGGRGVGGGDILLSPSFYCKSSICPHALAFFLFCVVELSRYLLLL